MQEEVAHEVYYDNYPSFVSGAVHISFGDRQGHAVAWAVCGQPFGRADFRAGLLRICMSYEHADDTGGMDFEGAENSEAASAQMA